MLNSSFMTTYIFRLKLEESDKKIIIILQKKYSQLFRILFNHTEYLKDKEKISDLRKYYNFSAKFMEYLISDVKTFIKKEETKKRKIKNKITKLQYQINVIKTDCKKLRKLKKDLKTKQNQLKSKPVFGNKEYLIQISKLKNKELLTEEEQKSLKIHLKEYKKFRLRYLIFEGETSNKGNRFFNLTNISEGNIILKFNATDIKIPINFHIKSKNRKEDLEIIEKLCLSNQFKVCIKLSSEQIQISFDKSVLEAEKRRFKFFDKKENRFAGIDLNPDGIGLSIIDDKETILKYFYSFKNLLNKTIKPEKRNFEVINTIKSLFKTLVHYKVKYLVIENLNFKFEDIGFKEANRKINNCWNIKLIEYIIEKYCLMNDIILIKVNPAYSSFTGNLKYNTFDAVASAIEITYRGILKIKYEIADKELILTEYKICEQNNDLMYELFINNNNWIDLYNKYKKTKPHKSVRRRNLSDFVTQKISLDNHKNKVTCYNVICS